MPLKIKYNSPVILTFSLICFAVTFVDQLIYNNFAEIFFAVPGREHFSFGNILDYFRLISHIIGHSNWAHLAGNFYLILLIGPVLEEKYGSSYLLGMILITALVTGLINALILPNGLMGASGIAFMLILLSPFTSSKPGEIPITFILIVILYLSREVFNMFEEDHISQSAHILGGIVGSIFGFLGIRHRREQ